MNPRNVPVAEELFRQWVKARGFKRSPVSRDFIRAWHHIEDAAFFVEATEDEIIRDLKDLEHEGWLKLVPEKYYRHRIAKIRIPLELENRWKKAFGFEVPGNAEEGRIAGWPWSKRLDFLRTTRITVPFDDLRRLDDYLKKPTEGTLRLPIKERSIEIFGDEKRLDELYRGSLLFGEGRLTLEALHCYQVPEPLAWIRGQLADGPVVVLENAATWDTYRRWDREQPRFSAIVYGAGERFRDGVRRLDEVFAALGDRREVLYFGDLDAAGMRIPRLASEVAVSLGYPAIRPDVDAYTWLIEIAESLTGLVSNRDCGIPAEKDLEWLEELSEPAKALMEKSGRIAQEWLNRERILSGCHQGGSLPQYSRKIRKRRKDVE